MKRECTGEWDSTQTVATGGRCLIVFRSEWTPPKDSQMIVLNLFNFCLAMKRQFEDLYKPVAVVIDKSLSDTGKQNKQAVVVDRDTCNWLSLAYWLLSYAKASRIMSFKSKYVISKSISQSGAFTCTFYQTIYLTICLFFALFHLMFSLYYRNQTTDYYCYYHYFRGVSLSFLFLFSLQEKGKRQSALK